MVSPFSDPSISSRIASLWNMLIAAIILASLCIIHEVTAAEEETVCHNATGACLNDGKYLCLTTRRHRLVGGDPEEHARNATGNLTRSHPDDELHDDAREHVLWSQRCDGFEDCPDGTDELACDLPNLPPDHPSYYLPSSSSAGNHSLDSAPRVVHPLFVLATCIGCQCPFAQPLIEKSHPWYSFALTAKPQPGFGVLCPSGRGCNPAGTLAITLQVYKKNILCRKAVCCGEQLGCVACSADPTTGLIGNANTKCYVHTCLTPTSP